MPRLSHNALPDSMWSANAAMMVPQTRFLTAADLPALLTLENEKWDAEQMASPESLLQRLQAFPELSVGAFCNVTGVMLASLFMRPVHAGFWREAASWHDCVAAPVPAPGRSQSLFGISLSSRHARGVEALLEFFWPHALKGGWRHIYLGSPMPGLEAWRRRHPDKPVQQYVAEQRAGLPLDPQLRYYYGRGFKDIICVKPDYFPHERSLDYGAILRGTVPLSRLRPVWRVLPLPSTQRVTQRLTQLL